MTSVIEELRDRVDKMYSALERLWCLTKNVMSTGGFCVTEENIYTGGNHNFDIMVKFAIVMIEIKYTAQNLQNFLFDFKIMNNGLLHEQLFF